MALLRKEKRKILERKLAPRIMVALLFSSMVGMVLNTRLVKAETYYSNLTISVTPESATVYDDVYVTVSFETASISYIVSSVGGYFNITIPKVVIPQIGHAEKTFDLGKLATGSYIFQVSVLVYNFEGQELLRRAHYESFTIGAIPLPILVAPSILDDNLVPSSIFRINITVDDVEKLWGYEFALWYDTNVLTAINYGSYPPFNTHVISGIDNVEGWAAMVFCTFISDKAGFSTINPTPIAWIDFQVDNIGTSALDFHYHSILANPFGEKIPHERVNGFFDNRPTVVVATLNVDPGKLNLRSKGKWITAYIQLPEGCSAADINASTILLNGTISPVLDPKYGFVTNSSEYLVDHNNDRILERMVEFDRASVESWIYHIQGISHGNVALAITGELFDGTPFEGTDHIFVNCAGDANKDGTIDIVDVSVVSAHWSGPPTGPLGMTQTLTSTVTDKSI